jgi:hypothetical protein
VLFSPRATRYAPRYLSYSPRATSIKKIFQSLGSTAYPDQLHTFRLIKVFQIACWQQTTIETEPSCFINPHFRAGHGTDFTSQADFAEEHGTFIDRSIKMTGSQRSNHTEVHSWLGETYTTSDIDKDILSQQ